MKEFVVLKVGTSTIVNEGAETLDHTSIERIGRQVQKLRSIGCGVLIVSSAARKRLPRVGWTGVVQAWSSAIGEELDSFLLTDKELDADGGCHDGIAAVCAGG